MANWTKAERARREAAAVAHTETLTVKIPEFATVATVPQSPDDIPIVNRGTSESPAKLLDAKEYADKILASRKSYSGLEQKLSFTGDHPGWKRRWVNEENVPGRQQEGYRFVLRDEVGMSDSIRYGNEDMGDRVSKVAGQTKQGHPFNVYLMEIPQQIADLLDKEKSHDQIARNEHSIRAGKTGAPDGNNRVGQAAGLSNIELTSS